MNYLGSLLTRICKESGTSVIYSIGSTTIQKLAEGRLEAKEIISVSGHKLESSHHNYWAPSLNNRKQWSNMLCTSCGNIRPLEDASNSATASPATQQRSSMDFMDSCFSSCTFNGSNNSISTNSPKCISTRCTPESCLLSLF